VPQDISEIKGNIPDSEKQVGVNGFISVMALGPIFLSEIGGHIRIVEMNVWNADAATSARAEIVFEIHVTTAEVRLEMLEPESLLIIPLHAQLEMCNYAWRMFGIHRR
jgi:hypothetical protein